MGYNYFIIWNIPILLFLSEENRIWKLKISEISWSKKVLRFGWKFAQMKFIRYNYFIIWNIPIFLFLSEENRIWKLKFWNFLFKIPIGSRHFLWKRERSERAPASLARAMASLARAVASLARASASLDVLWLVLRVLCESRGRLTATPLPPLPWQPPRQRWFIIINSKFKKKNRVENLDKSQNVVEQANSNSNNTSFVVSRRHIICSSSILATMKYCVTFLISYEET